MAASTDPAPAAPLLVFGDDGSHSADVAWSWLISHTWPGWSLDVVTVVSPPLPRPTDAYPPEPTPEVPEHPRLPGADRGFASAAHRVLEGDARMALSERTDASLLVIGPRGKSPLERLLTGSTANALLTTPPAPVVVARAPNPARRVLVATDGSRHAAAAVRALAALPLAAEADVVVLGVADDRSPVEDGIHEALGILGDAGIEGRRQLEQGMVPGIVLREVDEQDIDLVVLGTRGHSGLRRLWLGSTASAISQSAPCSVLVASESG